MRAKKSPSDKDGRESKGYVFNISTMHRKRKTNKGAKRQIMPAFRREENGFYRFIHIIIDSLEV